MDRYVCLFATETASKDLSGILMPVVARILCRREEGLSWSDPRSSASGHLHAALLIVEADAGVKTSWNVGDDDDLQPGSANIAWTLVTDGQDVEPIRCFGCTALADSLHKLADLLPKYGVHTDVFWFTEDLQHCDLALFGALKRMREWNDAYVTIAILPPAAADPCPSAEFEEFVASLGADVSTVKQIIARQSWPVWQGSVSLVGTQQVVKLRGFRMNNFQSTVKLDLDVEPIRKSEPLRLVVLSPSMKLVTYTDVRDIPSFYLTDTSYKLSLASDGRGLRRSANLLERLTKEEHSCFILRLTYGSHWLDAEDSGLRSGVSGERVDRRSWHQLLMEDDASVLECPYSAKLGGRVGYFNFLIYAVSSDQCMDNGTEKQTWQFVARRMRDPSELDGSIAHDLVQSSRRRIDNCDWLNSIEGKMLNALPRLTTESLRRFSKNLPEVEDALVEKYTDNLKRREGSGKGAYNRSELLTLAQGISNASFQYLLSSAESTDPKTLIALTRKPLQIVQPEYAEDIAAMAEWQALLLNTTDRLDYKSTLAGLSPPVKSKAVVLDAAEILKAFNPDGSSSRELTSKVVLKSARHTMRRYDSVDCRLTPWPQSAQVSYHDIYYCTGRAESLERCCDLTRLRLGTQETASTCFGDPVLGGISARGITARVRNVLAPTANQSADAEDLVNASTNGVTRKEVNRGRRSSSRLNVEKSVEKKRRKVLRVEPVREQRVKTLSPVSSPNRLSPCFSNLKEQSAAALEAAMRETLLEHDVAEDSVFFQLCSKRMRIILQAFVQDIPQDVDFKEEIKKIAGLHARQVILFEERLKKK